MIMKSREYGKAGVSLVVAILSLVATATSVAAEPAPAGDRVSVSKHMRGDGRENAELIRETRDEFAPLALAGKRHGKTHTAPKAGAGDVQSASVDDFWFYLADVELFADEDRDGYYSGIDLLFDVDTIYGAADIYAVAYLSYEGGPWEEYAVTEDFTIFGSSGADDYVIVTDLVSGYPTGSYDVLVEVFDAWTGEFLAWYGPEDTSELSFLPLEDIDRDTPRGGDTTVVVNSGGGGATGVWLLAALGITAVLLRRRATRGVRWT